METQSQNDFPKITLEVESLSFDLTSFWTILSWMFRSKGKLAKFGQNSLGFVFCPEDFFKWCKSTRHVNFATVMSSLGPYPSLWHGGAVIAGRKWGSLDCAQPPGERVPNGNLHLLSLLPRRGFVDSVLLWFLKKWLCMSCPNGRCVARCSPIATVPIHCTQWCFRPR